MTDPLSSSQSCHSDGANQEPLHFPIPDTAVEKLEEGVQSQDCPVTLTENDVSYNILSAGEKILVIMSGSFAALISPLSSSIYLPALDSIAKDMNVSISLINLTLTMYLIFQGLAPSFIGSFSDAYGRRPAYTIAFVIYLGANIGLALQNNYAALMVLRCLQSSGSSGTIALGSAVVADVTTRADRGKYIGYAGLGMALGPALGPVIGGLLDHFLGWKAIFWFLVILSGTCFIFVLLIFPETCRVIVGNGSIIPPRWNQPFWAFFAPNSRFRKANSEPNYSTLQKLKHRPNPITSLRIVAQKESGLVLIYGGLIFSGYMAVLSTLTTQLTSRYGFNSIQVGLCYLPIGVGSICSRWTVGRLLDWNFRREARLQGMKVEKNKQQDILNFNIERARLTITMPWIYSGALFILGYGWVMEYKTSLAGPIVMLFFVGLFTSGAFNTLNTLIVDINPESAATATAASNLCRCLMAAGTTAFISPLINAIGIGWTGTLVAALWVAFSPTLWLVRSRGHAWRKELHRKRDAKEQKETR